MDLHYAIELGLILLAFLFGIVIANIFLGRKIFESGRDRDGTILMFLLFFAFIFTLSLFAKIMTGEVISTIIGSITGSIGTAAAFTYKDKMGNGGTPKP